MIPDARSERTMIDYSFGLIRQAQLDCHCQLEIWSSVVIELDNDHGLS